METLTINKKPPKKYQQQGLISHRVYLTDDALATIKAIQAAETVRIGRKVSFSLAMEMAVRDYEKRHGISKQEH